MILKITSVDSDGFCGREFHPSKSDLGVFVAVIGMEPMVVDGDATCPSGCRGSGRARDTRGGETGETGTPAGNHRAGGHKPGYGWPAGRVAAELVGGGRNATAKRPIASHSQS